MIPPDIYNRCLFLYRFACDIKGYFIGTFRTKVDERVHLRHGRIINLSAPTLRATMSISQSLHQRLMKRQRGPPRITYMKVK